MNKGQMRRSKSGILIIFLIIVPIMMCVFNVLSHFYIFMMIKQITNNTNVTFDSIMETSMLDTVMSTISIAVSVWIGLNIYNVYKKEDIENLVNDANNAVDTMIFQSEKRKFMWYLEKGEYMYEISKYLYEKFDQADDIPLEIFKELTRFEKGFYWSYDLYERKRQKECRSNVEILLMDIPKYERLLEKYNISKHNLLYSYLNIRKADLLFYKNVLSQVAKKEEYLESIKLYQNELEKMSGENKELIGYMQNTIGYTYRLLCLTANKVKKSNQAEERSSECKRIFFFMCRKKDGRIKTEQQKSEQQESEWREFAKKYLSEAVENNGKGRYLQNLGSYYEIVEGKYEEALDYYYKAYKAEKRDDKIYNLLGAVLLKDVDRQLKIENRFRDKKVFADIVAAGTSQSEEVIKKIQDAYTWLTYAIKMAEPISNTYYNYSKACIYYHLFVDGSGNKMIEAEDYLDRYRLLFGEQKSTDYESYSIGFLFTLRNKFEAEENYKDALKINGEIQKKAGTEIGDTKEAKEMYELKIDPHKIGDNILDNFIQQLMDNHNYGANEYTMNLKGKEDYHHLLDSVYAYYGKNKAKDSEELCQEIFQISVLKDKMRNFIEVKKYAPGMVMVVGTLKYQQTVVVGNQQEINDEGQVDIIKMREDAIFDLSSITKIFTCIITLKLIDEGIIMLNDKISQADKRFLHLSDVSIEDLLTFRVPLRTRSRIEEAQTFEEAEALIFNIMPDLTQTRLYTDMGAIVLRYVIESKTGVTLCALIKKYILDPCNMNDTVLDIKTQDMNRVVSNNFERRIRDGEYITFTDITRGVVNDGKARKLEQWNRQLYGHAGLFSTALDMGKFAQGLIGGKILDPIWIDIMGINRTGKKLPDGGFSQFHGYLCYSKNPVAANSEVNHWLSGNAFALGGYTGNQLTIDYRNQMFLFMASNRCHNRITNVSGTDVIYDENDCIKWTDGEKYICNRKYAYDRDESIINPAIELAVQYRFIEYLKEHRI